MSIARPLPPQMAGFDDYGNMHIPHNNGASLAVNAASTSSNVQHGIAPFAAKGKGGRGRKTRAPCGGRGRRGKRTRANASANTSFESDDSDQPDVEDPHNQPSSSSFISEPPEKRMCIAGLMCESDDMLQVLIQAAGGTPSGDKKEMAEMLWKLQQQNAPASSREQAEEHERNQQRLQRMEEEEGELLGRLKERLVHWPYHSPLYPVCDLLGLMVVRYGLLREVQIPFGRRQLQADLQLRIMPLNFDLRPTVWMEPLYVEDMEPVYMALGIGDHFLNSFPANWTTRRPRVHLTALSMDITPFCDPEAENQRISIQFPSAGDNSCWEGVMAIFTAREASLIELIDTVTERGLLPSVPADADEDCCLVTQGISLLDPLTMHRLAIPVKGRNCAHRACFDLKTYLIHCDHQNVWLCPVCLEPCPYQDLMVDSLFQKILQEPHLKECLETDTVLINPSDLSYKFKEPLPCTCLDDD